MFCLSESCIALDGAGFSAPISRGLPAFFAFREFQVGQASTQGGDGVVTVVAISEGGGNARARSAQRRPR